MFKAVVWSTPNCPYCTAAKVLLNMEGFEVTVNEIGNTHTREQFMAVCPGERTVPQIFINDNFIPGGYKGLVEYLE